MDGSRQSAVGSGQSAVGSRAVQAVERRSRQVWRGGSDGSTAGCWSNCQRMPTADCRLPTADYLPIPRPAARRARFRPVAALAASLAAGRSGWPRSSGRNRHFPPRPFCSRNGTIAGRFPTIPARNTWPPAFADAPESRDNPREPRPASGRARPGSDRQGGSNDRGGRRFDGQAPRRKPRSVAAAAGVAGDAEARFRIAGQWKF